MHKPYNVYIDIYKRLTRLRLVEQHIAKHYPEQNIRCPVHLCIGQEGISAGLAASLTKKDMLFGTHRSHGPYIASGGNLQAFFAELLGKADGCCGGRGGSMHLVSQETGFWGAVPILGSTIAIATGAALALKMRKQPYVCAALTGDGATEEGVFHESLQFAALKNLPVIYVCENNQLSVNTPLKDRRAAGIGLTDLAKAHGLSVTRGDGNNPLFVYNTCRTAFERARQGHGPFFIEFDTFRWLEHCGPHDDHYLHGRSKKELEAWKQRCPVEYMRSYLIEIGVEATLLDHYDQKEAEVVEAAWRLALRAAYPDARMAVAKVYAPLEEKSHA